MSGIGIGVTIAANAALAGAAAGGGQWLWNNVNKDEQKAVTDASKQQIAGTEQGMERLDQAQQQQAGYLDPYSGAGADAVAQQRALAGLDGPEAQQRAISMLEQSPQFQSMLAQSEEALLANASATGGLRGGNTQSALMQLRPALLSQIIEQQYARLGGLSQMGYGAAGQLGQGALGVGQAQAGMLQDIGSARAGATLGRAALLTQGRQQLINTGASLLGGGLQLAAGAPPTALAGAAPQAAPQAAPLNVGNPNPGAF